MTPDEPIALKDAGRLVPGRPSYKTLLRWVRNGVRVPGGRVRLAADRAGGRWFTTAADVAAFLAAVKAGVLGGPPATPEHARAARRRELNAVLGT
jgi:hypothetical protein